MQINEYVYGTGHPVAGSFVNVDSAMALNNHSKMQHGAEAEAVATVARALAHPARVRIVLYVLSAPGCIGGDIVDKVGLSQSTVSEHLRILKEAGVLVGEFARPRVCYTINPDALEPLKGLAATFAEYDTADRGCCDPGQNRV